MKKTLLVAAGAAILLAGAAAYWMASPPPAPDPDLVAADGVHWHVNIKVYVNGVPQDVPANIGIGPAYVRAPNFDSRAGMAGMHTHDPEGTVHLEASGPVTRQDIMLGTFFRTWGKSFDDFGTRLNMKVNGADNSEGEAYQMQDGDQIILSFFP